MCNILNMFTTKKNKYNVHSIISRSEVAGRMVITILRYLQGTHLPHLKWLSSQVDFPGIWAS